ncbi:hypothetical protein SAMD00019534_013730, partial [Acytostelium subglobosum LB1]|uniref:hypothetical protein n=1 Tax=Acytostelium subglobosum LB1 TaxID=1410327 RepID=UPI000644D66E
RDMDRVFFNVDQLLDDTLKIVRMGVLSKSECKEIMNKRQEFEQKMVRKAPKKHDYLQYIKFELDLDQTVHKKGREMNIDFDYRLRSPLRNAMILFARLVHKFPKDEALWISYLNVRLNRASNDGTGRVFSLALQHNPRSAKLWKLAAAFEFEINRNIKAARSLIQLGLHYCPADHSLWHHFFTMELSYVAVLLNRLSTVEDADRVINGTAANTQDSIELDSKLSGAAGKDNFIEFGEEIYNATTLRNSPALQGGIATIVFNNAIANFKNDFEFRKQFYKLVQQFINNGKLEKFLLVTFTKAEKDGVLNESGYLIYVELLIQLNKIKEAMDVAVKATTKHANSINLWNQRINILIRHSMVLGNASNATFDSAIQQCFEQSIQQIFPIPTSTSTSTKQLKEAYTLCFQYLPVSKRMFQSCIAYQRERPTPELAEIRDLYERYLQDDSFAQDDVQTWLDYRDFELYVSKDINKANIIANRARKSLRDPKQFINALSN